MRRDRTDRVTRRATKIVGQTVTLAIPAKALTRPDSDRTKGATAKLDILMKRIAGGADSIIVAVLPDHHTAVLDVNQSNPGMARSVLTVHDEWPTPSEAPETTGPLDGPVYRIGAWVFAPDARRVDQLNAAMTDTPMHAEDEAPSTGWAAVADAFLDELRLPDEFLKPVKDARTRVSRQCQRLLPDVYVALGTPVRTMPADGSKPVEAIIAFTNEGPWLLEASKGNSGLPRSVVGPIEQPVPVSLEPIERGAGLLRLGQHEFRVPVAHVKSLRMLIIDMAAGPREISADEETPPTDTHIESE